MDSVEPAGAWWRTGVVYQIYPRSFQDGDGDGVGDLAGIVRRLDHLTDLGIDAIWLSPIYRSPMVDFGYDVTDHCDVDPIFGTLTDLDCLIAAVHERGMRIVLDFIPSHTSDRHPWFVESRRGPDSEKRDWYVWADAAADGGPPNNWLSEFGGPAWSLDPPSGQYYHHAHLAEQPDLNWRNPDVVEAMVGVMRFWFDRGVDGLRVDAVDQAIKDADLADNRRTRGCSPPTPGPRSKAKDAPGRTAMPHAAGAPWKPHRPHTGRARAGLAARVRLDTTAGEEPTMMLGTDQRVDRSECC